jgi:hypothetical protein
MNGIGRRFFNAPQGKPMAGMITPQQKIIDVAKTIGNNAAGKQQGTSFQIYDSLPLDGRTEFKFFEGSGARQFPFTNTDGNNGKLQVGETMVVQYAQIVFLTLTNSQISAVADLSSNINFQQGEISFVQGNSTILKRMKLQSWTNQFNKSAYGQENNVYYFDTYLTIQSMIEFTAQVRVAQSVTVANTFAQLILEGTGGILSPKTNF